MLDNWIKDGEFTKDEYINLAKSCEKSERYDDMIEAMKLYSELNGETELSSEARNLFSVAYKHSVGARRSAFRALLSVKIDDHDKDKEVKASISSNYRNVIVKELKTICNEVLDLLNKYHIPNAQSDDSQVFYLKMAGDYYRYLAEVANENELDPVIQKSLDSYQKATEIASKLNPAHPIRLGLALNFSVFYYEIKNMQLEASKIAQKAFADAMTEFQVSESDPSADSTVILQLLQDNLTLWKIDHSELGVEKVNS